jgi:hypothetical protein
VQRCKTRGVDEAAAARAAADAFWAAVLAGDGTAITSLMSPKSREDLVGHVRRWIPTVATAEEAAARVSAAKWTGWFSSVVTESVELQGTQAIARWGLPGLDYGRPDEDDYLLLVKLDGRWVVELVPGDDDPDVRPIWAFES